MIATREAYRAFARTFSDPYSLSRRDQFVAQQTSYLHLWAMYTNDKFDDLATWEAYRSQYRTYRYIRSIYNPTRRLVDFYAGIIYPGVLTLDADRLPAGQQMAIPLDPDIDPALQDAIGQIWQWSNWQAGKSLLPRYGACLGNVAAEVVDDLESAKVRIEILWPGMIAELTVDNVGDVKAYTVEYEAVDADGAVYEYRREVDPDTIRTYRDRRPTGYDDLPAAYDNPYGFAPLVWIPHTHVGGLHGAPCMRHISKFDEVNSLFSQSLDYARKTMAAPILLSGGGGGNAGVAQTTLNTPTGPSADLEPITGGQQTIQFLRGPEGATMTTLSPEGLDQVLAQYDRIVAEIENDHPELTMYRELRQMSQVTGPAADRLLGDAKTYVQDARSSYDTHSIKLFQMAVAVAGWRANGNGWGSVLNNQRQRFRPFDLGSYGRGDLDFTIQPRPLIPELPIEALARQRLEQQLAYDAAGAPFGQATAQGIAARLATIAP